MRIKKGEGVVEGREKKEGMGKGDRGDREREKGEEKGRSEEERGRVH
jgi:hypothetical protein